MAIPIPCTTPTEISRKSIALYYYTSTWSALKREHTTQFRARPDQGDKKLDVMVPVTEFLDDITPPSSATPPRQAGPVAAVEGVTGPAKAKSP